MKIALINGSPRVKSVSGFVLDVLKTKLKYKANFVEFHLFKKPLKEKDIKEIIICDVLVIAAPLYVDALPSHVMQALIAIENFSKESPKTIEVFAVSNGGFAEGVNNAITFEILSNWCEKCGFRWMYGLGIGSGERLLVEKNKSENSKTSVWHIIGLVAVKMFTYEYKVFEKIRKNSFRILTDKMVCDILKSKEGENVYVRPFFPKTIFFNNLMTNISFFIKLKANGNNFKDMTKRDK